MSSRTANSEDETAWSNLTAELDLWAESGRVATFWWRDDDAVEPTSMLETLFDCAGDIPIALAVIPRDATQALADFAAAERAVILQHGWSHESHVAGAGDEYPAHREAKLVSRELADGRSRLSDLFGERLLPVFAPPWHAFASSFLPLLIDNGIAAISRRGARSAEFAMVGLYQANAHVAPIEWAELNSFGPAARYLGPLVDHLRQRRTRLCDPTETTGLLTHHLRQNAASWRFMRRLGNEVSGHAAARWAHPSEVFAPATRYQL